MTLLRVIQQCSSHNILFKVAAAAYSTQVRPGQAAAVGAVGPPCVLLHTPTHATAVQTQTFRAKDIVVQAQKTANPILPEVCF
jgi:hypothetical protein